MGLRPLRSCRHGCCRHETTASHGVPPLQRRVYPQCRGRDAAQRPAIDVSRYYRLDDMGLPVPCSLTEEAMVDRWQITTEVGEVAERLGAEILIGHEGMELDV